MLYQLLKTRRSCLFCRRLYALSDRRSWKAFGGGTKAMLSFGAESSICIWLKPTQPMTICLLVHLLYAV